MDKHFTILGALFVALGLMGLAGIVAVLAVFFVGSAAIGAAAAHEPDVPVLLALLPMGLGLFISVAIAIGTVPSLIAGLGLLQRRPWARVWTLIAGIVNLPHIPIGTGVGAYAIWVFLQSETETALAAPGAGRGTVGDHGSP